MHKKSKLAVFSIVFVMLSCMLPINVPVYAASYNYGEALQKSILFYELQRSGDLPDDKRDNWRGDSGLTDGADNGIDLTGGWYDAGDHVKFNLPMSYTANMLAWSVYENREAYEKSGQLKYILDDIKWACDYFIKCHTGPNEYYYQVGDGTLDHSWWGPVEVYHLKRPSYKVTASSGGATVVAGTASALAAAAAVFKDIDPDYAAKCLKHAKELYTFADTSRSDEGYSAAANFYTSWSKWWDELSWACVWIYLASGDSTYIEKAESYAPNWSKEPNTNNLISYKWAYCWDDVHMGAALMLAKITNKPEYKELIEKHLDYWTTGHNGQRIKYSPKGLAFLDTWGSLRYATTTAFLADVYADWSGCTPSKVTFYKAFAKSQVDYALGSTGRSFVVGFGDNPPKRPHHRTAHSSWSNSQNEPAYHRHVLVGALVGGPDSSDGYIDDVSNYTTNEVACDYNAGFTAILARLYSQHGGQPIANYKTIEEVTEKEIYVNAEIKCSDSQTDIKSFLINKSAWPSRNLSKASFRYYMDLSEVYKAGYTVDDISVNIFHTMGGKPTQLIPWDSEKHVYYLGIDFTGTDVYPGGLQEYRKEVQIRISAPQNVKCWDGTNDFSYQGDNTGKTENLYIPVYDDGKLIFGKEPALPNVTPTTPPTPASPSPTPANPDNCKLSGYISPDFEFSKDAAPFLKAGFKVQINGTNLSSITDANGYFEIANIPKNSAGYTLKISKNYYLYRDLKNVALTADTRIGTINSPITMWAGDMIDLTSGAMDNAINMTDIMEVAKAFNSVHGEPRYFTWQNCDFNMDSAINMSDIMIVAKHFNHVPDNYPNIL